jgi:hypothetical protein
LAFWIRCESPDSHHPLASSRRKPGPSARTVPQARIWPTYPPAIDGYAPLPVVTTEPWVPTFVGMTAVGGEACGASTPTVSPRRRPGSIHEAVHNHRVS